MKAIKDLEVELAERQVVIVDLASQCLNYMALVEHPKNDFGAMDQQIYERNIQAGVIQMIKNEVQPVFSKMESAFQALIEMLQKMNKNKDN